MKNFFLPKNLFNCQLEHPDFLSGYFLSLLKDAQNLIKILMAYQYIFQALLFVWRSSKKWTILFLIVQIAQAFLPIIALYLTKLLIDAITTMDSKDFYPILQYVLLFGAIQLLQAVLQNYQQLISETQQQLVTDYMSTIIIDKAISIDLSYYENAEYHDTFHLAQSQAMYRPVMILQNLSNFIRSGLLLLSLSGLLLFLHWSVVLLLIAFALPFSSVKWYYSKKLYDWEQKKTSKEREANYLNYVLTTAEYAKEIRIFNLGNYLKNQFIKVRKTLFEEKFRIGQQRAKAGLFAQSAEIIALISAYSFIAWHTFQGKFSIGDLVMYFQAFQRGQSAIKEVLQSAVGLYNNRLFLSHLFALLKMESLLIDKVPVNNITSAIKEGITFKNVNFAYPGTTTNVLKDINLTFKKGEVVALVGANGSGKTSLVKLLCRLYDPQGGSIFWDNIPYPEVLLKDLRQRISVIYQDFAKYHFSIADNISIGEWQITAKKEKLTVAAKKSGAYSFIKKFPAQFDQQLGRWFKKGIELSGGQWQKIALARAFYKDAEVIILDEPSSSIDPLAEAAIFEQFRQMAKNKILILVTHRLYNLKMADKIIVLHEGSIIEVGQHHELITSRGLYSKMFEKQVSQRM